MEKTNNLHSAVVLRGLTQLRGIAKSVPALVVLSLVALLSRSLWISADPPVNLSWSTAPFTDEGLYCHVARSLVLFGELTGGDWDNRYVSPLFDLFARISFSMFGVGYAQLRAISVLCATVVLPVYFYLLRRDFGPRSALIGATIWGLDYAWIQFSRLGLLEPGLAALLVLAAYFWRRAIERGIAFALLCGVSIGLAFVWKSLALLFIPVPLVAAFLAMRKGSVRFALPYTLGLLAVGVSYWALWYRDHHIEIDAYNRFYAGQRLPGTLEQAAGAFIKNVHQGLFARTPIMALAGFFGMVVASRSWLRREQLPPTVLYCLLWGFAGIVLLVMPYSPPRYHVVALPALTTLALFGACRVTSTRLPTMHALAFACLCWSIILQGNWAVRRRHSQEESSRRIAALVPIGATVVGVAACALSLENSVRCVPPFHGLVNDTPIARFAPEYALVDEADSNDHMLRFEGTALEGATRLGTFPLGARSVTLFRLQR